MGLVAQWTTGRHRQANHARAVLLRAADFGALYEYFAAAVADGCALGARVRSKQTMRRDAKIGVVTNMALHFKEPENMHEHRTAKVVEIVGSSTKSFEAAIKGAIEDAASTTRGITGAHVENLTVRVRDGQVTEYRVDLKVAFGVEHAPHV